MDAAEKISFLKSCKGGGSSVTDMPNLFKKLKQALLKGEHHCCVSQNPEVKARGWDRQEYNVWDQ